MVHAATPSRVTGGAGVQPCDSTFGDIGDIGARHSRAVTQLFWCPAAYQNFGLQRTVDILPVIHLLKFV